MIHLTGNPNIIRDIISNINTGGITKKPSQTWIKLYLTIARMQEEIENIVRKGSLE